MAYFQQAGNGIRETVEKLIGKYHPDLAECEATFDVLFGFGKKDKDTGEIVSHALKASGYPAMGKAKIVSQKERAAGLPDFLILIDGDRWGDLTDAQQDALLDHELQHIEVRRDEEGGVMADDSGRPKMKYRVHDAECGIFLEVIKRHEKNALDLQVVIDIQQMIQGVFPEWR